MAIEKILIVDDETLIRDFLAETLKRKDFEIHTAHDVQSAYSLLKNYCFDVVITDMKMPDGTGIDVLSKAKRISPKTLVIIITAFGSIENAVEAMRLGAFNYLIKPFSPDTIEAILEKAQEHLELVEENTYLKEQMHPEAGKTRHQVIAQSAVLKKVLEEVRHIAKSNANVFINGESGTGKEIIAREIHMHSPRAKGPYIRVNCAAIPETLIESEFFGHEKGAFTGAQQKRIGRFELANHGSLLLDEVTEIPISLQPKLLRVIQEKEFERVGGMKSISVDTRIISTSNRNMKEAICNNIFREDLYYRLNVIPIMLPPLRERKDDILPLAEYFLETLSIENHKRTKTFTDAAKRKLLDYPWPGNIRELSNIIERAVVMDYSEVIDAEHLYLENSFNMHEEIAIGARMSLGEIEKMHILETFNDTKFNRTKTAERLGISIRTLRNKLKEYNHDRSDT